MYVRGGCPTPIEARAGRDGGRDPRPRQGPP